MSDISANSRTPTSDMPENILLTELLAKLRIPEHGWDIFMAGDGSGNAWNVPSGWAGTLIDKSSRGRRFFYGGMNTGSINLAESMPYLQAINWYDEHFGQERLKVRGLLNVHIVTDSEIVCNWGRIATGNITDELPRQHIMVWATLRALRQLGYVFHFHYAPRLSHGFNWAADLVAGLCRRGVRDAEQEALLLPRIRDVMASVMFHYDVYGLHPGP